MVFIPPMTHITFSIYLKKKRDKRNEKIVFNLYLLFLPLLFKMFFFPILGVSLATTPLEAGALNACFLFLYLCLLVNFVLAMLLFSFQRLISRFFILLRAFNLPRTFQEYPLNTGKPADLLNFFLDSSVYAL